MERIFAKYISNVSRAHKQSLQLNNTAKNSIAYGQKFEKTLHKERWQISK